MAVKLQADQPQYVVLRSKGDGNCLHFLWNEEEFGKVYKCMGTKRAVDPVSPFAKLEIVPSPGTYGAYVHLRSAYNNKYLKPVMLDGVNFLSATADSPDEDMGLVGTSTRFERYTPSNLPNTIWFRYAANQYNIYISSIPDTPALDKVACLYSNDSAYKTYFEYAAWESYEDKMKAKDEEIQKLKDQVAAKDVEIQSVEEENKKLKVEVASRDQQVQELKDQVAAKDVDIQSRDADIQNLEDQVVAKDGDIAKLKDQVAAWETYEEERKAKLEEEMKKLQSAWDSFQVAVKTGIDPPKIN